MEFEKRQRIREWVGKRVDEGMFERDIVDALVEQGVPEEDAIRETLFVMKIRESKEQNKDVIQKQKKNKGPLNMGIGGGVSILGLILTIAAEGEVVFVGAIAIGLIVFFIGIYQSATHKKEE